MSKFNFSEAIGNMVFVWCLALLRAFINGTILWIFYPKIHDLFPSALENGVLAEDLSWWSSVGILWVVAILTTQVYKHEVKK